VTEPRTPPTGPAPSKPFIHIPDEVGATTGWSAVGQPARRSLSYNGGPMTAAQYNENRYGPTIADPALRGQMPPGTEAQAQTMTGLERLGKTSLQLVPARASNISDYANPPDPDPKGFVEMLLMGLTKIGTGFLPEDLSNQLAEHVGNLGAFADFPLEMASHVPLPGIMSRAEAFEKVVMTPEKAHTIDMMLADPTNKEWYMAQYLRSHSGDVMTAQAYPRAFSMMLAPDATLLERAMGVVNVIGTTSTRTIAGAQGRGQQILNANVVDLPDELKALRSRYEAGELGTVGSQEARDRFLDDVVAAGYGMSNDPFAGMLLEIVTDPSILMSFGTGLAAKAMKAGAFLRRASAIGRVARMVGATDGAIATIVRDAERAVSAMRLTDNFDSVSQFARQFERLGGDRVKAIVKQADSSLSRYDRATVRLDPVIRRAAKVSEYINSPFRIFGGDGAAGAVRNHFARQTTTGAITAFGTARVAGLLRKLPDSAAFEEAMGWAAGYSQRSMLMGNLVRQLRSRVKRDDGTRMPAHYMPDAAVSPDDAAKAITDPRAAVQFENFVRRVMHQYVPDVAGITDEVARKTEYARQMGEFREQAALKLQKITGMDLATARSILKDADDYTLSFVDWVHYGRLVKDFIDAQRRVLRMAQDAATAAMAPLRGTRARTPRAAAKKALADQGLIGAMTIVGPRELTAQDAKALVKLLSGKIDEAALNAAHEAVEKFEVLYQNFWSSVQTGATEAGVKRLRAFLQDGLKNRSFVSLIEDSKVPAELLSVITEARTRGVNYRVGLAPAAEGRWRALYDRATGEIVGYNPWMSLSKLDPAEVKSPTRFDAIREAIGHPIRGENLLMDSRRKFLRDGVRMFGMDRGSTLALWESVRKAASAQETTMRAFTSAQFRDVLERTPITPEMRLRVGPKGLALLVARALEGDVTMVGVTSKLTGKSKTRTAQSMNFMGVLAEGLYPLMRFKFNPVFQMQEYIEPFFFSILRGRKPGIRFGEEAIEMHELLDHWDMGGVLADGFEARDFLITGYFRAGKAAGPRTGIARITSRLKPGHGAAGTKSVAFAHMTKDIFGREMHAAFEQMAPGYWSKMDTFFNDLDIRNGGKGNLSRGEIATRWFMNKGLYDPDRATTAVHHWDGAIPDDLGRIDGIRRSHLARFLGFDDIPAMKAAMKAGTVDEWSVRSSLVNAGFSSSYAERAWQVMRGVEVETLLKSIQKGFVDPVEGRMARQMTEAWIRTIANIKGITVEEYVARKFASGTKWLDSTHRLPPGSFTQLSDRISEEMGFPPMARDDPFYTGMLERSKAMMPAEPHGTQAEAIRASQRAVDGKVKPSQKQVDGRRTVAGYEIIPDGDVEDFIRITEATMDAPSIAGVADWYPAVGPMFAALVRDLDANSLRLVADQMNETMPSLGRIVTTDDVVMRQEVGARLLMAWGATQVQTSPRDGLSYALTVMDEMQRGKHLKAKGIGAYDPQKAQFWAMLRDFEPTLKIEGMGAKLHDFVDSLLGNRTRTYMRGQEQWFTRKDGTRVPMDPGAMDIWMGRDRGYIDSPMLGYLQDLIRRQNPAMTADEAMVEAQIQSGFFYKMENEKADAYRARRLAFEKEYETRLKGQSLREVWSGSPSTTEYESMLLQYNRLADEINSRDNGAGWQGRGYASGNPWTVADVQAVAWMRIQKQFGIDPGGPTNMFHQNSAQVSFEWVPGKHEPIREAVPLHRASEDAKDLITNDMFPILSDLIRRRTGVQIIGALPGRRGYTNIRGEGSISPNSHWTIYGPQHATDDAVLYMAALTMSDEVVASYAARTTGGPTLNTSRENIAAIDFMPSDGSPIVLDALAKWLDQGGFPWNGWTMGTRIGDRGVVRSGYRPWKGEGKEPPGYVKFRQGTHLDEFTAGTQFPAGMETKLLDGSWATEAGLESAVPVETIREIQREASVRNLFDADIERARTRIANGEDPDVVYPQEIGQAIKQELRDRGRADLADSLDGDMADISEALDDAFKRRDRDAWATGRGHRTLTEGFRSRPSAYLQSSPRGWRGATSFTRRRAATERVARGDIGGRTGRMTLAKGEADLTTIIHELFHFFSDDLDESAVRSIHEAWVKAKRIPAANQPKKHLQLTYDAAEWAADQIEEFAATGIAPNPTIAAVFKAYGDVWRTAMGRDPKVNKRFGETLNKMLDTKVVRGPSATFDVDQFRLMEAARTSLQRAAEEAFTVNYFKRGRTMLERSLNHPFLGMYPVSYMWGKVLPEMVRFMVRRPFGIDAPFGGVLLTNHVFEAMQMEISAHNEEYQDFVERFPEIVHILPLLLPGNPFDVPVNVPAWVRRISRDALEGKDPDIGSALTEHIQYTFGAGRAPVDMLGLVGDAFRFGQDQWNERTGQQDRTSEDTALSTLAEGAPYR
jgi:hypothetical protein